MANKTPTADDIYNSPSVSADDVYGSLPDVPDYSAGPGNKEGTYRMFPRSVKRSDPNKASSGTGVYVPYSKVEDAAKGGYIMAPEDHPRWIADATWDSSKLQGGPWMRFGKNALGQLWGAAKGTYHGLVEGPQNPEEAAIESDPEYGATGLRLHRFVFGPMAQEAKRTKEEYQKSGISPATVGHAAATAVPMLGPAVAQTTEQIGEQVRKGDLAGAGGTAAGFLLPFAVDELAGKAMRSELVTKAVPESMVKQLIRPMTADVRFGKDPVRAILDEGIVGKNLEEMGDKVADRLGEVGREIDRKVQRVHTNVDASVAFKPLNDAIAEAQRAGRRDLYKRLVKTREELYYEWNPHPTRAGSLQRGRPRIMQMTPEEATKFKRMIGDRIRWTKDPLDGEVNEALGSAYRQVKDATNAKVPGLDKLNQQYADLVGAKSAIERRAMVEGRNAHWSLSDIALGASGHLAVAAARKVAGLPAVRTRVARGLYSIPKSTPSVIPTVGIAAAQGTVQRKPAKETTADDIYNSLPDVPTPEAKPIVGTKASPFADAISRAEGFGTPGTIPTRANNPGSLKLGNKGYGTIAAAGGQEITVFGSEQEGWNALENQLSEIYGGKSSFYTSPDMTLEEFGKIYSGGNTNYGAQIAASLGVDPSTTLGELRAAVTPGAEAEPPAPTPLPQAKAEAQQRNPSPPPKQYAQTATGPNGHKIGSDDGDQWFDLQTGQRVN